MQDLGDEKEKKRGGKKREEKADGWDNKEKEKEEGKERGA